MRVPDEKQRFKPGFLHRLDLTKEALQCAHCNLSIIAGSIHAARSGLGQSPQVSEAKQCTGIKCNNTCYEQGGGALSSCCPGASRMYDPRTHVCCGGKRVYALTHAHKQACCSDRLYSTMGSLCCSGRVYAQYDANQMRMRCCGQLTFNPLTDTCCDGAVTKGVGDGRCCRTSQGVLAYDPASHLCCQGPGGGKLWSRGNGTGTALYCCGAETFEPSTSICCAGNVRRLRSTSVRPACCGSVAYDAARQHCCGGKVPERRQAAASAMCCGGKMIDGARKICCSGKAQSAERGTRDPSVFLPVILQSSSVVFCTRDPSVVLPVIL